MNIMNKNIILVIALLLTLVVTSCSVSKRGNCGCPSKRGMVGY